MNSAITIRKTLARIMAFWQWWQPKTASPLPSLPATVRPNNVRSHAWSASARLPFDPLDCEELGVFDPGQSMDMDVEPSAGHAFDPPSFPAGAALPSMAAVPMAPAAPKPFRPRRNVGTPGRRDGAGTH